MEFSLAWFTQSSNMFCWENFEGFYKSGLEVLEYCIVYKAISVAGRTEMFLLECNSKAIHFLQAVISFIQSTKVSLGTFI